MRRFSLLIAALALSLAGVTASAAAVSATAARHAHPLTSLTATRPAGHAGRDTGETAAAVDSCHIAGSRFTEYGSDCGSPVAYTCQVGNRATLPYPPSYVSSGCGTRVLLYTSAKELGDSLCIGPDSATNRLSRAYRSFRVGSSHSC